MYLQLCHLILPHDLMWMDSRWWRKTCANKHIHSSDWHDPVQRSLCLSRAASHSKTGPHADTTRAWVQNCAHTLFVHQLQSHSLHSSGWNDAYSSQLLPDPWFSLSAETQLNDSMVMRHQTRSDVLSHAVLHLGQKQKEIHDYTSLYVLMYVGG